MSDKVSAPKKSPKPPRPHWAAAIARFRNVAGLSQKQFAEKLGASQTTIASWETGQNEPNLETLDRIAKALEVSIGDLIETTPAGGVTEVVIKSGTASKVKADLDHTRSIIEVAELVGTLLEAFYSSVSAAQLQGTYQPQGGHFGDSELWAQIYRATTSRYDSLRTTMTPSAARALAVQEVVGNFNAAFLDLVKRDTR